ncbi:MAG: glycosyltransferase family 2 protein [Chloroflexota bacterium]|nr:MAG: glycosyltransferase family 2 protein [Chloroflexota bacterium]
MSVLEMAFWLSALVAAYAYVGYGIVISALAAMRPRPHLRGAIRPSVALIIAAHNEEAVIREKIVNSLRQTYPRERLEIVVVSDGSTDATPAIVQEYQHEGVVSLYQPARMGKAAAMQRAAENTRSEILVFSDANSMYTPDTIENLVRNFADPQVGCVSGEKQIRAQGQMGAVKTSGLYWRYESYLKRMDSKVNSVVGAAGEIFATRRSLFRPAESDSIIEDFVISMRIAAAGHRVIYEPEAISVEEVAASTADEYERRVRISAGGFQSIVRLRRILISRRWLLIFQYLSHRVLRWAVVPFLLPVLLLTNIALAYQPLYQGLLALQLILVALAGAGWACGMLGMGSPRLTRVPFYFYMLNVAALVGFYRYISGRQKVTWTRTRRLASEKTTGGPTVLSQAIRRGSIKEQ